MTGMDNPHMTASSSMAARPRMDRAVVAGAIGERVELGRAPAVLWLDMIHSACRRRDAASVPSGRSEEDG